MTASIAAVSGGASALSGASWSGPPNQKMSNLFDSIDAKGTGSISQTQFNSAFQTKNPPTVFQQQGASAIWSQLDPKSSGSVSKPDFVSTMSGLMSSLRADPGPPSSGSGVATSIGQINQLPQTPYSPGKSVNIAI